MQWPDHIQSPVDWDPAWNEWVGLPETPRSARPAHAADIVKQANDAKNEHLVPDVLEYQRLVLSKVGDVELLQESSQKPRVRQACQRPSQSDVEDSDKHMQAIQPAAKPPKKRKVRKAALINRRHIVQQKSAQGHADHFAKIEKVRMHRSKGRVYGGSADKTGLDRLGRNDKGMKEVSNVRTSEST